jgi:hypothetical protein
MKFYVSMTTIPSRIFYIYKTIDSILSQSYLPEKIFINIPKYYKRFNKTILSYYPNLTPEMFELEKIKTKYKSMVEINIIDDDYGPGTKLLGILTSKNDFHNDDFILLVDDDVIYKTYAFDIIYKNIKDNKNAFTFHSYDWNGLIIGQGVDIFALPIDCLDCIINFYEKIKSYQFIFLHDDIWISYYLMKKHIKINKLKHFNETVYDQHCFIDELHNLLDNNEREFITSKSIDILKKLDDENIFLFMNKQS